MASNLEEANPTAASGQDAELKNRSFPVVGVGASAGGLEAFTRLLHALPAKPGFALVFIQHLDPQRDSLLVSILAQATSMSVSEAKEGQAVEPNHLYVIPPNTHLSIAHGALTLLPRGDASLPNLPIDIFLQSLSADMGSRAAGVILSGGGSDGTRGVEAVRAAGGLTFAQEESTAIQDSMPRSAIASGCIDSILPPEGIANELTRVGAHTYMSVGDDVGKAPAERKRGDDLSRIFSLIRARTGVDFAQYKQTTVQRRLERRMAVLGIENLGELLQRLEKDSVELEALYQDLLLRVTSFFRDAGAFDALQKTVFPKLIPDGSAHVSLRIWVPGCSTGEEAYSIAMAVVEYLGDRAGNCEIKILATDVNEDVLEKARAGVYLENIVADVSADRLRRFFRQSGNEFRIAKSIRDLCIFSRHNLLIDPPFARMDLISCRNVLIYFEAAAQRRVLPLFHYALEPKGYLMLGPAETIGTFSDLFKLMDGENKIYTRNAANTRVPLDLIASGIAARVPEKTVSSGYVSESGGLVEAQREADRLLSRFAPPGVLVNEKLDVLQFRGDTSLFLKNPPGAASLELLRMAAEGLRASLHDALTSARGDGKGIRVGGGSLFDQGVAKPIAIQVIPLQTQIAGSKSFLVLFEDESQLDHSQRSATPKDAALTEEETTAKLVHLQDLLDATREHLQSVIEEHGAAIEEVKSANEEILASNEELQSTNEEIQTAREELQSTNEELKTTNEELHYRNRELGLVNTDLTNLLSGVNIPIVMVNRELKLRRFAAQAEKLFNIHASDVGRPIQEIRPQFHYPDLAATISRVIDNLESTSLEIQDHAGRWYLMRIRPYETLDNKIDGAVLTAIDIDSLKRGEQLLRETRDFNASILDTVQESLVVLNSSFRILRANPSFFRIFHLLPEETNRLPFFEIGGRQWDFPEIRKMLGNAFGKSDGAEECEVAHTFPDLGRKVLRVATRPLSQSNDDGSLVLLVIEDVTERKRIEEVARNVEVRSLNAKRLESLGLMAGGIAHDLNNLLTPILGYAELIQANIKDDGDGTSKAKYIAANARRAADLVQQILAYSGKGSFVVQSVPLSNFVRDMSSLLGASIGRNAKLQYDLASEDSLVKADATQLTQVVLNLTINAAESIEGEGVVVIRTGRIQADAETLRSPYIEQELPPGSYALLEIEDNGAGIPEDKLDKIFDPFFTTKFTGRGLGLSAVLGIVKGHHGTIQVFSKPGQGTRFRVLLPCLTQPTPMPIAPNAARVDWMGTGTILVVDDEPSVRMLASLYLESFGYTVLTAVDGRNGVELFTNHPDICGVLIDLTMPHMNGMETVAAMRKIRSDFSVVVMSGYSVEDIALQCQNNEIQGALQKPFNRANLLDVLKSAFQKSRRPPERK